MIAAYETLPKGIKGDINKMRAIHDVSDFRNYYSVGEPGGVANKVVKAHNNFGSSIHSLVKYHPEI